MNWFCSVIIIIIIITTIILLFIHSFIQNISIAPLKSTTTQRRSRHSMDTVPEFHAEAPQATVSEELVQGPYMVARAGVEPMAIRTKGVNSTNAPPSTTLLLLQLLLLLLLSMF